MILQIFQTIRASALNVSTSAAACRLPAAGPGARRHLFWKCQKKKQIADPDAAVVVKGVR